MRKFCKLQFAFHSSMYDSYESKLGVLMCPAGWKTLNKENYYYQMNILARENRF